MRTVNIPAPDTVGTVGLSVRIALRAPALAVGGDEERTLAFCGEGHRIGVVQGGADNIGIEALAGEQAALYALNTPVVAVLGNPEDELKVGLVELCPPYLTLVGVDVEGLGLLAVGGNVGIVGNNEVVAVNNRIGL